MPSRSDRLACVDGRLWQAIVPVFLPHWQAHAPTNVYGHPGRPRWVVEALLAEGAQGRLGRFRCSVALPPTLVREPPPVAGRLSAGAARLQHRTLSRQLEGRKAALVIVAVERRGRLPAGRGWKSSPDFTPDHDRLRRPQHRARHGDHHGQVGRGPTACRPRATTTGR